MKESDRRKEKPEKEKHQVRLKAMTDFQLSWQASRHYSKRRRSNESSYSLSLFLSNSVVHPLLSLFIMLIHLLTISTQTKHKTKMKERGGAANKKKNPLIPSLSISFVFFSFHFTLLRLPQMSQSSSQNQRTSRIKKNGLQTEMRVNK